MSECWVERVVQEDKQRPAGSASIGSFCRLDCRARCCSFAEGQLSAVQYGCLGHEIISIVVIIIIIMGGVAICMRRARRSAQKLPTGWRAFVPPQSAGQAAGAASGRTFCRLCQCNSAAAGRSVRFYARSSTLALTHSLGNASSGHASRSLNVPFLPVALSLALGRLV